MKQSKYFSAKEFERCTPTCSIDDMSQELLDKLDLLREACNMPLVLNCAYRSKAWDKSKGRSGNSAHTKGLAVDIRANAGSTRFKIVQNALKLGFNRIGVASSFIHVDISKELPQNVIWTY